MCCATRFASLAADLGLGDSTIAGLLGHSRSSVTSRYIHLDKALIAAADLVAAETKRLMRAGMMPHVAPFSPRGSDPAARRKAMRSLPTPFPAMDQPSLRG